MLTLKVAATIEMLPFPRHLLMLSPQNPSLAEAAAALQFLEFPFEMHCTLRLNSIQSICNKFDEIPFQPHPHRQSLHSHDEFDTTPNAANRSH